MGMANDMRSIFGSLIGPLRELRLRRLAQQAVDWRERLLNNGESAHAGFADWLLRSPDHVSVWLELTAFDEHVAQWLGYPELQRIVAPVSSPTRQDPEVVGTRAAEPTRASPNRRRAWLAAASLTALMIGAIAVSYRETGAKEYITAIGEQRQLLLEDGSTINLNTHSHIVVRLTSKRRLVEIIEGEALFDLAADPRRPFVVAVAGVTIEDVGTRFSVRSQSRQVSLLVAEGRIRVSAPAVQQSSSKEAFPSLELSEGDAAEFDPRATPLRASIAHLDSFAVNRRLAWTNGRVSVAGEALGKVVADMNRYSVRQIAIVDPRMREIRIGGTFKPNDPEAFAQALANLGICAVEQSVAADGTRGIRLVAP